METSRKKRAAPAAVAALLIVSLAACNDDVTRPEPGAYRPQTTPENVLDNLQQAYRNQDAAAYSALLADDFRFYVDPYLRQSRELAEFWDRSTDSTLAAYLFHDVRVAGIRCVLQFGSPMPVAEPGRAGWTRIDLTDTYVQVDLRGGDPVDPFAMTVTVDGQPQRFFFRAGRSAADTLAESPTRNRIYLVEWDDPGYCGLTKFPLPGAAAAPQVVTGSWTSLKLLY